MEHKGELEVLSGFPVNHAGQVKNKWIIIIGRFDRKVVWNVQPVKPCN